MMIIIQWQDDEDLAYDSSNGDEQDVPDLDRENTENV